MSQAFITLGDTTSHGGTVISADMTWTVNGRPVARVGDKVVCRKCRGTFSIATGAPDMTGVGQALARHGDKTECGATLIASQVLATWGADGGGGGSESVATESTAPSLATLVSGAPIAAQAPSICLECLKKAAQQGATMVVRD
jgi:uncharacterized Zn-binding protein involved in type VI secretion